MIKAVIIINLSGKARIVKFYEELGSDKKTDIINRLYKECISRGDHACCFIEDSKIWDGYNVVFRQYATLLICFVVDGGENELAVLDMIQVFVEVMDKTFQNVCELDLIFYPEKIYTILEEIIMGGMVVDTNIGEIWKNVKEVFDSSKKSS